MIFIELLYFLALCFIIFYLPGRFLLRKLKFDLPKNIITHAVSIGIGVSMFLVGTYLLAWVQLSILYTLFILPLILLEIRPSITELSKFVSRKSFFSMESGLIFIGTVAMTYLAWRSGSVENGKMVFFGIHAVDSIYHQSLIGNLSHTFPPTHPGIAGMPLRGYNFFYDFLTVQFAKLYLLDRFDLFFRFMPLFTTFFYGISGLALAKFLKFNRLATLTTIYLLYFAQNFSFFFRLLPNNFAANFNFEIIQSLGNIHDPSVVFSSTLIFLAIITLFTMKKHKQWIIPALLLGIIPTMKIHSGVIAFAPLGLIALFSLFTRRDIRYLGVLFLSGIIASVTYLPINYGAGHLIFYPFLLYRHYMDSAPMFKNENWSIQYIIFQQNSNYLRMGFINITVMLTYLLPNLGIRLVSLLLLPKLFKRPYWSYPKAYLLLTILICFIVPTLFIQSVYAFVIIQFLWVASIFLIFPTAVVLSSFVMRKNTLIYVVYIGLLLILTLPQTVVEIYHHSVHPYEVRDGVYTVSQKIPKIVGEKESILAINRKDGEGLYYVPLVSALSGRSLYFEPEVLEFADTAAEIKSRVGVVNELSDKLRNCTSPQTLSTELKEALRLTKSEYLLVMIDESCMKNAKDFIPLAVHDGVSLYKVN